MVSAYFNNACGVAALLEARADPSIRARTIFTGLVTGGRITAFDAALLFGRQECAALLSEA